MKRKILIISILIVIITGVLLVYFRHDIVGHAFKITISKKTHQTVSLNIGHLDYSILSSTISFTDTKLVFHNTYVNQEKTIYLSSIEFDKVTLEDFSLWSVLFKREFSANRFIIDKPSIWFMEDGKKHQFKEKPKKILKNIKAHPGVLGDIAIRVNEVEITHGELDIKSLLGADDHEGSVDFHLLLRNFDTSKEGSQAEDRVLFAKEHFVKLSNFKYMLPNGDKISFDSTVFKSARNILMLSNVKVSRNSKAVSPADLQINEIVVGGLDFEDLEKLHDIKLDSLSISDVYLTITEDTLKKHDTTSASQNQKTSVFSVFNELDLGFLVLNNINVIEYNAAGDTTIDVGNFNFKVNDLKLDSTILLTKKPDVDYNSIRLSSGIIKVFEQKSGLRFNMSGLHFNEDAAVITISDIDLADRKPDGTKSILAHIASLDLSGVSVEDFIIDKPMKLGVFVNNPSVEFDISKASKHKNTTGNAMLDKFEINEIQVTDGLIHLFEKGKLDVSVHGLNINSGMIQIDDINKIHAAITEQFNLSSSSIKVLLPKKQVSLSLDSLLFTNNKLIGFNILGNIHNPSKNKSSVFIDELQFAGANIEKLIEEKEISLQYINVLRPKVVGRLYVAPHMHSDSGNKSAQAKKPGYKLNIDNFNLTGGNIDLRLTSQKGTVDVKSGISINIRDIADADDSLWLEKVGWNAVLKNSEIDYKNYKVKWNSFTSNKSKALLIVEGVDVDDDYADKSEIDIRALNIKSVELSGVDYNTILRNQKPYVQSVAIKNPNIDIIVDSRYKKDTVDSNGNNKAVDLPIEIDELLVDYLSLKVEKIDSVSISNYSLNRLDFGYKISDYNNIIDGIEYFDMEKFVFSDTAKNSFAKVDKLDYSKDYHKLSLSSVQGGSISRIPKSGNYLSYALSELDISELVISYDDQLDVGISDINVDGFQLDIESSNSSDNASKSSGRMKMKLPEMLKSVDIDNITGANVDINHVTITDTSEKKLVLEKLAFEVESLQLDSSLFYNDNYAFAENVSISLGENKFISSDSLYATSIEKISYDFSENRLSVDSLKMKPRYKPDEFFKQAVFQTGKMDIVAGNIVCNNVRLNKLVNEGVMHMGGVDVYGLDMRIFRNKKYKMNPELYKKMPQDALLSIPNVVTVDSLKTYNAYIQYKQLSKKSIVPGMIFLNKVNLNITNINNNLEVIDTNSLMVANLNAMIIGESKLDLKMEFPILSPAYDFYVSGHLDRIDFNKLNSMTQNLVGVTLESGYGELDIPLISGDSTHSEGLILFKYKKLGIELYDRDKAENATGLGGSMANLLLNDIFVKSNNPGFLGKTRSGEVYFHRNTQKSIVYYTWKSILSGLMSTMGYNNKEQRQEKRARRKRNNGKPQTR